LTEQASGLLDTTKALGTKLEGTKKELEQDFTDEEIDDQLGDVDFVNDFAEQLFEALERLNNQCDITIKDCAARKKALTDALIWDRIGEEDELVMLAAGDEAKLMSHFYDNLASGCTKFYSDASNKFGSDGDNMKDTITQVGAHKYLIMNYAKEDFHKVKGALF
jgi:hypothetical protein